MKIHHKMAHGESIAKESAVCFGCDETFSYYPSEKPGVFCPACVSNGRFNKSTGVPVACEECGAGKTVRPSIAQRHEVHFCDPDCRNTYYNCHVEVNCTYCGSPKTIARWKAQRQENVFCDYSCADQHFNANRRVDVECTHCDETTTIQRSRYEANEDLFCSAECYSSFRAKKRISNQREVFCECCGAPKFISPSKHSKYDKFFCDSRCQKEWMSSPSNPAFYGSHGAYGEGWSEARKLALERDDYACQICSNSIDELGREPDVHHIIPANEFPTKPDAHYLSNLVCLCKSHHGLVEQGVLDLEAELPESLVTELEIPTSEAERQTFIETRLDARQEA